MVTSRFVRNNFLGTLLIFSCSLVNAGLNNFTNLVFVDDWLIERKVDLTNNQTKCRASIPSNANWFGARVRLGLNDELIKPLWISVKADQVNDSKLTKIKGLLEDCRSGFLFLPENL
tara:strand:+ start:79 stop:429 length:351 start_codon:yes stop_codon:yes gene_type:complete